MSSAKNRSFASQAFQVLVDWRIWIVALPFAILCLLVDLIWGRRASAIAAVPLGIVGSFMLARLDIDPEDRSVSLGRLIRSKNLLYAIAGIMIVQGAGAFPRFAVLPWHWLYGEQIESHPLAIVLASGLDWLSFVLAGWCIGHLAKKRALFASMAGVAVFLPIGITDLLTTESTNRRLLTFARAMGWLSDPDFDWFAFRTGVVTGGVAGLLTSALLTIYVARFVSLRASYPITNPREESSSLTLLEDDRNLKK